MIRTEHDRASLGDPVGGGDLDAGIVLRHEKSGGTALLQKADVADDDQVRSMIKATVEEFGRIDYLVNNAAIYQTMKIHAMVDVPMDYYNHFMAVNMNGALLSP